MTAFRHIVMLSVAVPILVSCGSDPTGAALPVDGTWTLRGLFTDFDLEARC